ncbi:MAG TPA: lyase family protein, partial [Candidatus Sulfotelmatobacter sp.]|nr:lyase family protein [Candidatus Sulfotelmatobacter sp.]
AEEVAVGQVSGAVGTHATVPSAVEEHVCSALGLRVAPVTTQVIARDRHAAFLSAAALFAAVLERLATTIRLLQMTEVGEAEEPFGRSQKGSSAMPHKRNPVLSERLCGLARVIRGHAVTALEDVALWHERDISHSSAERIILPETCALLVFMLRDALRIVTQMSVDSERMRANLEADGGLVFSQRLVSALITEAGWDREHAYRTVQELAAAARAQRRGLHELSSSSAELRAALQPEVMERCFDLGSYLENIDETFRRLSLLDTVNGATRAEVPDEKVTELFKR